MLPEGKKKYETWTFGADTFQALTFWSQFPRHPLCVKTRLKIIIAKNALLLLWFQVEFLRHQQPSPERVLRQLFPGSVQKPAAVVAVWSGQAFAGAAGRRPDIEL